MAYKGSGAKGPAEFAEKVLSVKLWPIQREIMRAVEMYRRVALAGCHASSKTHTAACLALWFASRFADSRVLVVSPTWLQVRSILWSEIHNLLSAALCGCRSSHKTRPSFA
jgi:hypothetical protein